MLDFFFFLQWLHFESVFRKETQEIELLWYHSRMSELKTHVNKMEMWSTEEGIMHKHN